MNLRQIKSIIKEFENSKVSRMELSNDVFSIKLEKDDKTNNNINSSFVSDGKKAVVETEQAALPKEMEPKNVSVQAPLVGTFYNSPSPDSNPFVSINQTVKKGDVLCIVEAMKVMNEIVAPSEGKIIKINVKDGTMVSYGDILMEIQP
jgi:acetyl-CoA carboxylase biotin carboxyl carrier protein